MVSLIFSGDFAPLVPLSETNKDHFSAINDLLSGADLHITNLECPLTSSDQKTEKTGPHIKADREAAALLPQAGVDIVCLANNHIFDYGEKGIIDTIKICEEINIETLGIVSRHDGKAQWIIREIKGLKLGFLNYCEHEFSVRSKGLMGACGYDPVDAYYDISRLRPQVDYLIVLYHGGNEYYDLPRPGLKKDFHYLADIGADAVFGHHTHV
ncbi:MAG: CapA family protein, partial [Bacteroidales bacterium]|nr:CapA family protein [Bacteroidales bacterium]